MIVKLLGAGGVLAALVLGAVPANAEPLPPEPNPFGGLTCECQGPVSGESPVRSGELQRGLTGSHRIAGHSGRGGVELGTR